MNEVPLKWFLKSFKESCENNERFCFILGSGASVESGIPTGLTLAQRWIDELNDLYTVEEIEELKSKLKIKDISVSSENYFDIYNLRFYPNYQNGYAYIQRIMENAQPSFGYYPLAKQLADTRNNLVITTNFDCMVEDALFIYTDKRPIVVAHESLAGYISLNTERPIIAKIHRGLFFEPFNRQEDLAGLKKEWQDVLKTVFKTYTPIVIGYAGGDKSLMKLLKDNSVELNGLYWCHYKKDKLPNDIKKLIEKKNGYLVPMDGFDATMFPLIDLFNYPDPSERISDAASKRVEKYQKSYEKFSKKVLETDDTDVKEQLSNVNDRWLEEALERVKENPKDYSAHITLAYQFRTIKEFGKAIDILSKAIELQSEEAKAFRVRGDIFYDIEKYDEAIEDYTKAIELKPDDASVFYNRGIAYDDIKEYDKAIEDYTKSIELKPEDEGAYNNRGIAYRNTEEYEKAMEDYNKAIELKPDYAKAYNNRGFAYMKIEEFDKAIADCNKAIELKPDYAEVYDSRGCVYFDIKEYDKAITDFSKAIELKPDLEETYRNRAKVYEAMGEKEKVQADIKKADKIKAKTDKK